MPDERDFDPQSELRDVVTASAISRVA